MTDAAQKSLEVLRDPAQFGWWMIPLLVLVIYVYTVEVEKKNWSIVLAGLAFWGMDWFNETWNGLVLHFSGVSACWTCAHQSAFLIFTGLNIEITLMFAFLGIVCVKMLPPDKNLKILGIPNRPFFIVALSILCVIIEIFLNLAGALVWHYWWWSRSFPFLIILLGYMPFMAVSFWVYDMEKLKSKITAVAVIFTADAALIILFGAVLKWI